MKEYEQEMKKKNMFINVEEIVIILKTICLYIPGPVPAGQRAHRKGIYSNPLINGLIQHTFKNNVVFVENFPVIP